MKIVILAVVAALAVYAQAASPAATQAWVTNYVSKTVTELARKAVIEVANGSANLSVAPFPDPPPRIIPLLSGGRYFQVQSDGIRTTSVLGATMFSSPGMGQTTPRTFSKKPYTAKSVPGQ